MPKLSRARFVNIGPPRARMIDLSHDYTDDQGDPTDCIVLLRNGGGKTTQLRLFFSVLRPGKKDFLQTKPEPGKPVGKGQSLEDFVLPNDRSLVALEWVLDKAPGEKKATRYVTGAFYEWKSTLNAEGGRFHRLWFAFRVHDNDPRTTLEGIPIFSRDAQGRKTRRSMSAFRDELGVLRKTYQNLDVVWTEVQEDWNGILSNANIDSELFLYQIKMNQREGGADALFNFKDADGFLDFLLDLVLEPTTVKTADELVVNVTKYRDAIRDRKQLYIPESTLTTDTIRLLSPFKSVRDRRQQTRSQAGSVKTELTKLGQWAMRRSVELNDAASKLQGESEALNTEALGLDALGLDQARWAAAYNLRGHELALATVVSEYGESEEKLKRFTRDRRTWEAAVPLAEHLRCLEEADRIQRKIDEKKTDLTPLYERLVDSARTYANSTAHHARLARRHEENTKSSQNALWAEAERHNDDAVNCRDRAATAEAQITEARVHLGNADREKVRLIGRKALKPAEEPADAPARLEEELNAATSARDAARQKLAAIEKARGELRDKTEQATQKHQQLRGDKETEERFFKTGLQQRAVVEANRELRRLLDTERADIEAAPANLTNLIEEAHRHATDAVVRMKVESAAENRAIQHLQDHGLLPPTPEVERIVVYLREKLPEVVTGWRAIADLLPSGERRAFTRQQPAIAMGIVVRDADVERAQALVAEAHLEPDAPIVITSKSAIAKGHITPPIVLGPKTDAHYDFAVAKDEITRRKIEFAPARAKIVEAETFMAGLAKLKELHTVFREQHPRGWFAAQEARVLALREQDAALREDLRNLEKEGRELATQETTASKLARDAQTRIVELDLDASLVKEYLEIHESRRASRLALIAVQETEKQDALKAQLEAIGRRDEAAALAKDLTNNIAKHAEEARQLETALATIEYLDGHKPTPAAGDLTALRNVYEENRLDYRHRVGEEQLMRDKERAILAANVALGDMNELLGNGIERPDAETALGSLEDKTEAKKRHRAASELERSERSRLGGLSQKREAAQGALKSAQQIPVEHLPLPAIPTDPAVDSERAAFERRDEALRAKTRAAEEAQRKRDRSRKLADDAKDKKHTAERLEEHATQSQQTLGNASDLLDEVPVNDDAWIPPAADKDVGDRLRSQSPEIQRLKREMSKLNKERDDAHATLTRHLNEATAEQLKTALAAKLALLEAPRFEEESEHWIKELEARQAWLEAAIKRVDEHRDGLIESVLNIAEAGLRKIHQAEAKSEIPASVPKLGGERFLHITTREPPDRATRRDRMALLVDNIAEAGNVPDGPNLVKNAVRDLVKPASVRVLFPDADVRIEFVDVSAIGNHSGGERLTSAVLLYCALANLRAQGRGRLRRPTSLCVLDNPFGTVSRPKFIHLQRAVAAANGIQLIYTTHIMNMEAFRAFPKVVSLRNESVDLRTGHSIIEIEGDQPPEVEIQAAAVGRREAKSERAGDDDE